jgi:hypothetical protein
VSSLDDVYEQIRLFQRTLSEFNEEIRSSALALAKTHEDVSALWQDEAGVRYRQSYEPLAQSLSDYLRVHAPRFERFMDSKVRHLERYLQR